MFGAGLSDLLFWLALLVVGIGVGIVFWDMMRGD